MLKQGFIIKYIDIIINIPPSIAVSDELHTPQKCSIHILLIPLILLQKIIQHSPQSSIQLPPPLNSILLHNFII